MYVYLQVYLFIDKNTQAHFILCPLHMNIPSVIPTLQAASVITSYMFFHIFLCNYIIHMHMHAWHIHVCSTEIFCSEVVDKWLSATYIFLCILFLPQSSNSWEFHKTWYSTDSLFSWPGNIPCMLDGPKTVSTSDSLGLGLHTPVCLTLATVWPTLPHLPLISVLRLQMPAGLPNPKAHTLNACSMSSLYQKSTCRAERPNVLKQHIWFSFPF